MHFRHETFRYCSGNGLRLPMSSIFITLVAYPALAVAGVANLIFEAMRAPEGYEDETGFHTLVFSEAFGPFLPS
jgi:hypothetical protein